MPHYNFFKKFMDKLGLRRNTNFFETPGSGKSEGGKKNSSNSAE
jgi:hypothetical protein